MRTVPSTSTGSRVAFWRHLLDGTPALSPRFRARYALALARAETRATNSTVSAAIRLVQRHPEQALRILAGCGTASQPDRSAAGIEVSGEQRLVPVVRGWLDGYSSVASAMEAQPMLAQTRVPIHPDRRARLLHLDETSDGYVGLAWDTPSCPVREANAFRVADLAAAVDARFAFTVEVPQVFARDTGTAVTWVISPNLGPTLEDRLRDNDFPPGTRGSVVASLSALRDAMLDTGVVWQGFAPRNMFLAGTRIVLIDFEEVADTAVDPARAAECAAWHEVFFADCLTPSEHDRIFTTTPGFLTAPESAPRRADAFEAALLGRDTVTLRQRLDLIAVSARLEGRHPRPETTRDGGVLFGHELGHFWGDFLPARLEARLFRVLSRIDDPQALVACLELCEAAMEADIVDLLRAWTTGEGAEPGHSRTVIDTIAETGPNAVARARGKATDWYVLLEADPAGLVDAVVFDAHTRNVEPGSVLIGESDQRDRHTAALTRTLHAGLDFIHRGVDNDEPFLDYQPVRLLCEALARDLPREGRDFDAVLADVESNVTAWSIGQSHRSYLAFPDSGNAVAGLAGAVLAKFLNQNLIALDRSAPAATFVEAQVIEWLRELIGYDTIALTEFRGVKDVAGLWTTGGHLSNHVAMLTALGHAFPQARSNGLLGLAERPGVVMAGAIAHYSHSDAAFHLGLGWESIIKVDAQPGFTTDPAAVDKALADPPDGVKPFMVVGVAGNCRTTGLDDLAALADICRDHGVWFHVDACHGGSLIFHPGLKQRHLAGIEHADSVSLDPHKGLFTPYPSSYVVFKNRGVLNQFSRHTATVDADGSWDLGLITPFLGSRGFESLATWMMLQHIGTDQLGNIVAARQALVRYLASRLTATGLFTVLNDVDFYRVAFVFCPPRLRAAIAALPPHERRRAAAVISEHTSRLNARLYESGTVCFDEHTLADLANRTGTGVGVGVGLTVMAACPGNPLITRTDLDNAVAAVASAAADAYPALASDVFGDQEPATLGVAGPAGWSDAA